MGVSVANRVAQEYTPGVLKEGDPAAWRQRTFTRHALFGFMAFRWANTPPHFRAPSSTECTETGEPES